MQGSYSFSANTTFRKTLTFKSSVRKVCRRLELTNRLGNVLVTISDRRTAICDEEELTLNYSAVALTAQDFFAFGTIMEGRSYEGDMSLKYRFGFNAQEKDDEIYGKGNSMSAEFWEYDTRLGRRWNIDPVIKLWESNYSCLSNSPIWKIDPKGDDDFFNADGTFAYSSKTKTNNIKIIRIVDGKRVEELLADHTFKTTKAGTGLKEANKTFANIAYHYDRKAGSKFRVEKEKGDEEGLGSYLPDMDYFSIRLNGNSKINPLLNDFNNLKSLLYHENLHKERRGKDQSHNDYKTERGAKDHLNVYFKMMEDKTFENTTKDFKEYIYRNVEGILTSLNISQTGKPPVAGESADVKGMRTKLDKIKMKYKK